MPQIAGPLGHKSYISKIPEPWSPSQAKQAEVFFGIFDSTPEQISK
jgi:hypothetical protein